MRDVPKFLNDMKESSDADLAARWTKIEDYFNKKLWHQITVELLELVKLPALQKGDHLVNVYNNFIADFETKINPLSLVQLAKAVLETYQDSEEGIKFIEKIGDKVKLHVEAFALTKVLIGKIRLDKLDQQKETKVLIDEVDELLGDVVGVSPVHSHFYLLSSDLNRKQGKHADFYKSSLRFLGCTELSQLKEAEQVEHAFYLSLAALLGEGVYNFGELLAHPILESLKKTEHAWLIDMLFAFNSGDVVKFRQLQSKWGGQPDLAASENLLFEKVCLLCLMEMTFNREATQRQISFEDIANKTSLPVEQVELLVMRALSQGLVKGKIDQVDKMVHMTWVQPRVLNKDQLQVMIGKMDSWCKSVADMEKMIENKAGDILTY